MSTWSRWLSLMPAVHNRTKFLRARMSIIKFLFVKSHKPARRNTFNSKTTSSGRSLSTTCTPKIRTPPVRTQTNPVTMRYKLLGTRSDTSWRLTPVQESWRFWVKMDLIWCTTSQTSVCVPPSDITFTRGGRSPGSPAEIHRWDRLQTCLPDIHEAITLQRTREAWFPKILECST